jgi:Tfp pilus assembly protein PilX
MKDSSRHARNIFAKSQNGFALVVALLLMVALSIVGVAALRNVSLQERMTGNLYARVASLQESRSTMRLLEQEHNENFGTDAGALITASGTTWWTDPRPDGSGGAYWSAASSWTTTRTVSTPLMAGFASYWTSENLLPSGFKHQSCALQASQAPCERISARQTVRVIEANTGALTLVQQYFYYFKPEDSTKAPPLSP